MTRRSGKHIESEAKKRGRPSRREPIKLLEVGGEGGDIGLFGFQTPEGEWRFFRETNEHALMDLLSPEEAEGLELSSKSETVSSWEEAVRIMDRYPWPTLYPLYVHPAFVDLVMSELTARQQRPRGRIDLRRWTEVCEECAGPRIGRRRTRRNDPPR